MSLATAEAVVGRLRAAVESTGRRRLRAFAGLYALDDGRLLAASTDGVGTKLDPRPRAGRLRACGADLAAHCINDVLTTGAEPCSSSTTSPPPIELDEVAELVEGAAAVCRAAGCAILGGETAELLASTVRARSTSPARASASSTATELIDGSRGRGGRRVSACRRRACTRTASRSSAGPRRRGLRRRPPRRRRGSTWGSTRAARARRAGARPRHGRRDPGTSPRAPRRASRALDREAGSGRRCSRGSTRRSRRRSCAASSTSASATAPSCPGRRRRPVIGRTCRVIGVLVSGEGTNLQALIDAGLPVVAVASNLPGPRRSSAPTRRRPDRRLPARGLPDRADATRRWPTGSRSRGVRLRRLAGYMHLLHAGLPRAVPEPGINVHPSLLPSFPARTRSRTRSRPGRGDRRNRSPRRRGDRHGAGDPQEPVPVRAARRDAPRSASRPWSTGSFRTRAGRRLSWSLAH